MAEEFAEQPVVEEPKAEDPREGKVHWDSDRGVLSRAAVESNELAQREVNADEGRSRGQTGEAAKAAVMRHDEAFKTAAQRGITEKDAADKDPVNRYRPDYDKYYEREFAALSQEARDEILASFENGEEFVQAVKDKYREQVASGQHVPEQRPQYDPSGSLRSTQKDTQTPHRQVPGFSFAKPAETPALQEPSKTEEPTPDQPISNETKE